MDAINTIQRLGGGRFLEDLAKALAEVSEEVVAAGDGAKGKVTVTFDLLRQQGQPDLSVIVRESINKAVPKSKTRGAMFFSYEGDLHLMDPRSPELPAFREVEQPAGETRAVEDKTAERTANA